MHTPPGRVGGTDGGACRSAVVVSCVSCCLLPAAAPGHPPFGKKMRPGPRDLGWQSLHSPAVAVDSEGRLRGACPDITTVTACVCFATAPASALLPSDCQRRPRLRSPPQPLLSLLNPASISTSPTPLPASRRRCRHRRRRPDAKAPRAASHRRRSAGHRRASRAHNPPGSKRPETPDDPPRETRSARCPFPPRHLRVYSPLFRHVNPGASQQPSMHKS